VAALEDLEPLVGAWTLEAHFDWLPKPPPEADDAVVTFEWMPGDQLLVERWTIPVPEAPDGLAVIGPDPESPGAFLQHYFDTRGVVRVYKMTFDGTVWRLWRDEPDFSPLEFRQRFAGTLSDDGNRIDATWEICHDGTTWEKDFDLTYTRR
jgi:hypothetical protein